MKFLAMVVTLSIGFSNLGFAETAILCGDLKVIGSNDAKAAVHVDFSFLPVQSAADVKFLNSFGKRRQVISGGKNGKNTVVQTKTELLIFPNVENANCDGDEMALMVSIVKNNKTTQLPCLCFND